jgi:predicted CopG family antitoxin
VALTEASHSRVSKTITIDDDAYKLLASLKQNGRDSFTKVILRHVYRPAETRGELLDLMENEPPPPVGTKVLERLAEGRGRKSGGRK